MTTSSKASRTGLLTQKDRRIVKLLLQSKGRIALITTLIILPFLGSTGLSVWLYAQNQKLVSSTREVVGELEVLDQEIEVLSRRAGLPRVRPEGVSGKTAPQLEGRGGVPTEIEPEVQLEIAKSKLPVLAKKLEKETKPALEKTLKKEVILSKATPTGNPVAGTFEVSSDFGIRPNPYGGGGYEGHDGIDILGAEGTPIYATANGKAIQAQYGNGYGYHVVLKNAQGYETLYAHLSKLAVKPQAQVQQGQLIGFMGNTGRSTGTHLHYSVFRNGKAIDPKPYMASGWRYSEGFN